MGKINVKTISTLDAIKKFNWPTIKPKSCEITLHYLCNAKCIFCYTENPISDINLDIRNAILNMKRSYIDGSRLCQIIGGEPTTYPELEKIIIAARKIGYPIIQIVTNGLKLHNYYFFKSLVDAGLNSVTFSIHSTSPQKHNNIVGVKDAFTKVIKSVENAIKLKIHITIGTAVTSLNYKDIPKLVRYFNHKYSIESFHIIALHMIGQAGRFKNKLSIRYTETLPYIKEAVEYLEKKKAFPLSQILSNYTPCLLPGYEELISDWKIPFYDDDLILPEKSYYNSMYTMITNNLRMKSKKCSRCIYYKICAGFEKKYFNEFGDSEFKPLNKIYKPPYITCFYKR